MRVYYRGSDALVTDTQFIWSANAAAPFLVADLRNIQIVRRNVATRLSSALLASAGAGLVVLVPGFIVLDTVVTRVVLGLGALVCVLLAASGRRSARRWELRAEYRRREVTLYSSADHQTFHQVSRALQRAVESANPIRSRRRMVAA